MTIFEGVCDARANRRYHEGEPGFYTVNRKTRIAVFGPGSEQEADDHRRAVNLNWPVDTDSLIVVEIPAS